MRNVLENERLNFWLYSKSDNKLGRRKYSH